MGKTGMKSGGEIQNSFFKVKTYSVASILAAGGSTAFAKQVGKDPKNITSRLKTFSQESFLTNEEVQSALETLKNNK